MVTCHLMAHGTFDTTQLILAKIISRTSRPGLLIVCVFTFTLKFPVT